MPSLSLKSTIHILYSQSLFCNYCHGAFGCPINVVSLSDLISGFSLRATVYDFNTTAFLLVYKYQLGSQAYELCRNRYHIKLGYSGLLVRKCIIIIDLKKCVNGSRRKHQEKIYVHRCKYCNEIQTPVRKKSQPAVQLTISG